MALKTDQYLSVPPVAHVRRFVPASLPTCHLSFEQLRRGKVS